jgi:hypothetical protein
MLKICFKDFVAARWIWAANGAVVSLFILQLFGRIAIFAIFGAVLSLSGLGAVSLLEDRNNTEKLYASLPLNRETIVKARYLLSAGLIAATGFLLFVVVLPFGEMIRKTAGNQAAAGSTVTPEIIALFLILSSFLASLYLPLQHWFGFGRGTVRFGFATAGLIGFGLGLGLATDRGARILAFLIDMGDPAQTGAAFQGFLGNIHKSLGTPLFLAAAIGLCVVLYLPALGLSLKGYARREF